MKEINWMKKRARVSEKLVSPGLPGLQVATRLIVTVLNNHNRSSNNNNSKSNGI